RYSAVWQKPAMERFPPLFKRSRAPSSLTRRRSIRRLSMPSVRTRTRYISVVRSLLGREGIGLRSGGSSSFVARVGVLLLPHWQEAQIAPLLAVMKKLNEEIRAADDRLAKRAKANAVVRRLCTVPGVGIVTAVAFRATLDEAERFRGAHQVECYLGLVPREMS